jgi:hypothetical protein
LIFLTMAEKSVNCSGNAWRNTADLVTTILLVSC